MKIGILGAGNIGGNLARLLATAGHDIVISFSRDAAVLGRLADQIGARAGSPADPAAQIVEQIITDAGFDPVRTGTLDRNDVGHQEPKGDLYGEEFHHPDALAALAALRGNPPSGKGRP